MRKSKRITTIDSKRRFAATGQADESEWNRLTRSKPAQREIAKYQRRYGFPFRDYDEYKDWSGCDCIEGISGSSLRSLAENVPDPERFFERVRRYQGSCRELRELESLLHIPVKFKNAFWNLVILGNPSCGSGEYYRLVEGEIVIHRVHGAKSLVDSEQYLPELIDLWETVDERGPKIYRQIMQITPDTDINSPEVIRYINDWQDRQLQKSIPKPIATGEHGKVDWRPVWEWEKRHPRISRARIAKLLDYHAVTVRRALENLDSDPQPDN